MKYLVIGGNGFIGSHLVDSLLDEHREVIVYDHSASVTQGYPGVRAIRGELDDTSLLLSILAGVDVVYHLVSTTLPATGNEDPAGDVRSNVVGSVALLEACVKTGVKRLVFLSSGGTVYGIPTQSTIAEDHPTNPICSYGITKLAVEKYIMLYHHLYGLDYLILRGSNAYGERQKFERGQGAIGVFLSQLARGQPITVWGDGSSTRDYIYVGDLAAALVRAGAGVPGGQRTFNVGSGVGVSLEQLMATIEQVTGLRLERRYLPARPFDVRQSVLDTRAIRQAWQWSPTVELAAGIERTWRWVKTVSSRA